MLRTPKEPNFRTFRFLPICAQFFWCSLRGDKMCRERLHILSFSGDNVCRVRQNVPLRVHILSPATNCAGATKCAVTHLQNLISSSLYYSGPVHKISSQSVHKFLSNVVHRQTDRQTDRQTYLHYQKHSLLCQGGNN